MTPESRTITPEPSTWTARLLVMGEPKASFLAGWPRTGIMQVAEGSDGRLSIAGGAAGLDPEEILAGIEAFHPDLVLYSPTLARTELHRIAMRQAVVQNLPLAIWIDDPWPSREPTANRKRAARLDADLRWLAARADARFCGAPALSDALTKRYGRQFVALEGDLDHDQLRMFESSVRRVAAAHRSGDYPRDLHARIDEPALVATILGDRRGSDHVMLDIGAQRGDSASPFDALGWTVWCFEPNPIIRRALAERFAERPNVHIDPRAVGEASAMGVPIFESRLNPGAASLVQTTEHHEAFASVDVTTVAEVVDELHLTTVDALRIDVEGLELAVLKTMPWERFRPDVIECSFNDADPGRNGGGGREAAAYLQKQGYVVYVSEWHPVMQSGLQSGIRHDWRRSARFAEDLVLAPSAWGTLIAFREDVGPDAIHRAVDRHVHRAGIKHEPPPGWDRPTPKAAPHRRAGPIRRVLRRIRRLLRGSAPERGAARPRGSTASQPAAPPQAPHGHELVARMLPAVATGRTGWVVEIGSTREKVPGQGSTAVLAGLSTGLGLPFVTVDMDPANTRQAAADIARFPSAQAVTARGEEYLASFEEPIVAAYLDAFDIQHGRHSTDRVERYRRYLDTEITNAAASAMHLEAAVALLPRLIPGGLVVIDDTWRDGSGYAGKGSQAVPALLAHGYRVVDSTENAVALRSPEGDA